LIYNLINPCISHWAQAAPTVSLKNSQNRFWHNFVKFSLT